MSFLKKIFGSGIVDESGDEYRKHAEKMELKIADSRDAMYKAVLNADTQSRAFQNAAGEMRMMRGQK